MTVRKIQSLDDAMARVVPGARLMVGEFVGSGEPARCLDWLVRHHIGGLTLIAATTGIAGAPLARLIAAGLVAEFVGSHGATSPEGSDAYLSGRMRVRQFYPMGTWAEMVRAGAVGLGGVLVPVGVGVLDAEGLFPDLAEPKRTIEIEGRTCFVEPPLRADVAIIKGWRADALGNVEFRHTGLLNQRDLAMAADYAIAEVNEIVPVGTIPPERVGCPGPFVQAVVQGETLAEQDARVRGTWVATGRLAPAETPA